MAQTPPLPMPEDIPVVSTPLELFIDSQERVIVGRGGGLHGSHPNEGIAYIGRVFEQGADGPRPYTLKPVLLDIAQPHRVFISGKSGSGKSYTLGVFIEEIQKAQMGVACVVVDIMGVFTASKEPNHEQKEMENLVKWNLVPEGVPNVKIFVPLGFAKQVPPHLYDEAFSFKPDDLEVDDWLYMLNLNFNSATGLCLSEALNLTRKQFPSGFSIQNIIDTLQKHPQITDPEKGFALVSRKTLSSKLQGAQNWGIFSAQGTDLARICQADTCAILDVNPLNENLRALVTGILARKILEARRRIARGSAIPPEDQIPITWVIVDEAHNFAPAKSSTPALEALVRLAKEGRHPGANLVLATQQPGATSNEIISQCDILITHNLSYDEDIRTFKAKAPCDVPKEMIENSFIRGLPVGVGILAAQSMKISRAFVVQVRPRTSQHGGKELLPAKLGGRGLALSPEKVDEDTSVNFTAAEEVPPPELPSEQSDIAFKVEKDFYPDEGEDTMEQPSDHGQALLATLKSNPLLAIPDDLAEDVVERSLTFDTFFPKVGPFDAQTERFHEAPAVLVQKAAEILGKSHYSLKAQVHESGAWLVLAEHNEASHTIFFALTTVKDLLIAAFKALPVKANMENVLPLKKFVKMLEVGLKR